MKGNGLIIAIGTIIVITLMVIFFRADTEPMISSENLAAHCEGCKRSGGGCKKMLPVMEPTYNLREAAKNMLLLEDHLFHQGKRCPDCILKHCYLIEGLLDECVTLDKDFRYNKVANETLANFRDLARKLEKESGKLDERQFCQVAQAIREIRKPLIYLLAH